MDAQGITEFTDQLPLIAGFASAYAEVNAEQTQKVAPQHIMTFGHHPDRMFIQVVQTFSRSLSCNLECDDMIDLQVCLKTYLQQLILMFCAIPI